MRVPKSTFAFLYFLNAMDCFFSLYFLHWWKVEEWNPLLRWAFELSPVMFVIVKCLLVLFSVEILRNFLKEGTFRSVLILSLNVIYLTVVLWHLSGLYLLSQSTT